MMTANAHSTAFAARRKRARGAGFTPVRYGAASDVTGAGFMLMISDILKNGSRLTLLI